MSISPALDPQPRFEDFLISQHNCVLILIYCSYRIHHYSIERQPDASVMIQDGKRFIGPVELVRHHSSNLDGFLTKPTIPCKRPDGYPIAWPGVTYLELEQALLEFATKKKLTVS